LAAQAGFGSNSTMKAAFKMDRRRFMQTGATLGAMSILGSPSRALAASSGTDDREYWVQLLTSVANPVLTALSERKLKETMPIEAPRGNLEERRQFTYLEALGRTLTGIASWLESGPSDGKEGALRIQCSDLARKAIDAATDPASPDFMNFCKGSQPVVDTAFLALAILRAPNELWKKLDVKVQRNTVAALESSRKIPPGYSNWLLFPAMIEVALSFMGVWWDPMRVDYAIRTMNTWYKGDGVYGDGPELHCDYYNSFVIQPMLLNILDTVSDASPAWRRLKPEVAKRAQRYAAIQEKLIGPDGSFPPVGRSICYRFGAFHLLAEVALRKQLPEHLVPAQVRSALTAVMRRMMEAPGTFDKNGWLHVGFYGHQPELAEPYISTGSCYLCSAAWLPLGLPAMDPFWADNSKPWTSKKAWNGESIAPDRAMADGLLTPNTQ
jgi:hypothetical protein